MTPEARQRIAARRPTGSSFSNGVYDSYESLSLYDRCITRGYPSSMLPAIYGDSYQIVQGQGFVAIRIEMIHETRIIPLGNQPHASKGIELDMGDPRGHWEGNTLVVETTNFRDRTIYRNGNPATFKLVERFTPTSKTSLEWTVTVDDPSTWTRPWTLLDAADGERRGAALRVRVPRRQLRDQEHPERLAHRGRRRRKDPELTQIASATETQRAQSYSSKRVLCGLCASVAA